MAWHLTWQDPVALALVIASLLLSRWLARRFARTTGCASCTIHELPAAGGPAARVQGGAPASGTVVPLDRLRLGKVKG